MARAEVRGTLSQPGPRRPASAGRLARTLGAEMSALHCSSRISAWRRGLNSHEAIAPLRLICRVRCIGKPAAELRIQGLQIQAPRPSRVATKDKNSTRQVGAEFRVGSFGTQSVLGAVAISSTIAQHTRSGGLQPLVGAAAGNMRRALKSAVPQRLAGRQLRPRPYSEKPSAPNPSLNRTSYGRPPWPGLRYAVHYLSPGQGVLPPPAG